MARKTASRGRPIGSGVNDAARLAAIADMLAANPGMKLTTAIRKLGITDASAIRRLRDKFHHQDQGIVSVVAKSAARQPHRHNVLTLRTQASAVRKEEPARRAARSPAAAKPVERASPDQATDVHRAPETSSARPDLFTAMFAAGVSVAHVTVQLQFRSLSYAFEGSPLACFVRGQEFMRLMTASFLAGPAETRCSRP